MPRAYGLTELQRVVTAAFDAGHRIGRIKREYGDDDVPRVAGLLSELGIEHSENVAIEPGKPRSWHPPRGGGGAV